MGVWARSMVVEELKRGEARTTRFHQRYAPFRLETSCLHNASTEKGKNAFARGKRRNVLPRRKETRASE